MQGMVWTPRHLIFSLTSQKLSLISQISLFFVLLICLDFIALLFWMEHRPQTISLVFFCLLWSCSSCFYQIYLILFQTESKVENQSDKLTKTNALTSSKPCPPPFLGAKPKVTPSNTDAPSSRPNRTPTPTKNKRKCILGNYDNDKINKW